MSDALFNARGSSYWAQTRQPLCCLIFLAPLLVAYEVGVFWVGPDDPDSYRNGADFWMRGWLQMLGLDQWFLLPTLLVVGLMGWHLAGKYPWRFSPDTLAGMFAESLLFAFFLVALGQAQDLVYRTWMAPPLMPLTMGISVETAVMRTVTFLGAGVYEEVLFRLCLVPAVYWLFRVLTLTPGWSLGLSVLSTSLCFSLAHYVGPFGDPFSIFSFTFRALAGLFFALLFCFRGFGITVGAHAIYDILVGVLMPLRDAPPG